MLHVDQLSGDSDATSGFADAAFEDEANVEAGADFANVLSFAFEEEGRGAGGDAKSGDLGEGVDNLLGDAVAEEVLVFVRAHVDKGEDGDAGGGGRGGRGSGGGAHLPDGFENFGHGLVAGGGCFRKAAIEEGLETGGGGCDGRGCIAEDGGKGFDGGWGVEGAASGEHFVEDGAEGENVATVVDGLAAGLFGSHVGHGAEEDPGGGEVLAEGDGDGFGVLGDGTGEGRLELGETEIEDLEAALADHEVGRFEIAVDDAGGVRGLEGGGELGGVLEGGGRGEAGGRDETVECLAVDELHGDEVDGFGLSDFVDNDDAGVIEGGGSAGFLEEAKTIFIGGGRGGGHDFEGDGAVEAFVAGFVDGSHAALAELFEDPVMRECAADHA